jgi:hypothetical protein
MASWLYSPARFLGKYIHQLASLLNGKLPGCYHLKYLDTFLFGHMSFSL